MQNTVLVPEKNVTPVRLDPAWDTARELLQMGRDCAGRLAAEIARLRGAFEHGGARRGSSSQTVNLNQGAGFVSQLAAQLGLHPQQAKRIEEAADYQLRIERVADAEEGSEIEVPDKGGATRCIVLTAEHIAQAKQAVAGMALPGAPRPSRAWAGIMGEGCRVGEYGAGKRDRDTPDNLALWVKAAATIRRIGPQWEKLLRPGDRVRAIDELSSALAALPQHVREAIAAQAAAEASR